MDNLYKFWNSIPPEGKAAIIGFILAAAKGLYSWGMDMLKASWKAKGFDKGLRYLAEFEAAAPAIWKYLERSHGTTFEVRNAELEKAANQIAMKVPGVTGAEMIGVVRSLAANKTIDYGGITLSVGASGVEVNPTGLAVNKAVKLNKWLKKVF